MISNVISHYRGPSVCGKSKIFNKYLACMLSNPMTNCGTNFLNTLYILCSIDFSVAYDFINKDKLWYRFSDIGISTKMISAVRSFSSCVRLSNHHTDWFDVKSGLRHGCSLSTLLFNLFTNVLALKIKPCNIGIPVNGEIFSVLLYADDIVL